MIVSSRSPSFEPARGGGKSNTLVAPVEERSGEPELNVIGSSD